MEALLAFIAIAAVVIIVPGPDTALTTRNTLMGGRSCGLATSVGVVQGLTIWTLATSAGLAALLVASEPAFIALKVVGAGYLVYLGAASLVRALCDDGAAHADEDAPSRRLAPWAACRQGLLSDLGNPKIAVFFTTLLPQFAPSHGPAFPTMLAFRAALLRDDARLAPCLHRSHRARTRGAQAPARPAHPRRAHRRDAGRPRPAARHRKEMTMIARIWKGAVRRADGDEYAQYLRDTGLADYAKTPGNAGTYMLRRDTEETTEYVMFTLWDSVEAIKAFAGEDHEKSVYYAEDDRYLIEKEPGVAHYEVETP